MQHLSTAFATVAASALPICNTCLYVNMDRNSTVRYLRITSGLSSTRFQGLLEPQYSLLSENDTIPGHCCVKTIVNLHLTQYERKDLLLDLQLQCTLSDPSLRFIWAFILLSLYIVKCNGLIVDHLSYNCNHTSAELIVSTNVESTLMGMEWTAVFYRFHSLTSSNN